jgi:hypothetical protein
MFERRIVSIFRPALLCRSIQTGIIALSDILMLALIVLAVLVPAAYVAFCRAI